MHDRVTRHVAFGTGHAGEVDLNRPVLRLRENPILTAADVNKVWTDPALRVMTVHNAAVARHGDETVMLFRSHLRCGRSVIGLARGADGITGWRVAPAPALKPAGEDDLFAEGSDKAELIENEAGGVEDPRITEIDGSYAITYSAYHARVKNRVRVSLATTGDFVSFTRHGPLLGRDMRNVVLFPEKIGGAYVGLFRPNDTLEGDVGGGYTQIRIGYTDDWRSNRWEIAPTPIMQTGHGPSAFSDKIGPGAPPIKTSRGWLNIFHGVRTTMDGNPYVLGVALHEPDDPSKVKMCGMPILFPSRSDCRVDHDAYVHVPNVVFTCGALRRADGSILIYYGGNDTVMNGALTHEDVLIALCERYGQDPLSGRLMYRI